jgi:phosphatidylglycerol:prolipoprotein diacylglycerol transferase
VLAIIIGGRIGYVLFYNPFYFLSNPSEILAVWHGGMSFHGGLVGAIFGMWIFCKKYKIEFLRLMDVLAAPAAVGLFFGRLANFINLELYGRVTGSNYGVIFPNAGSLPRHPSQLYEAFLEGIMIFIILFSLSKFTKIQEKAGKISGLFLIFYGSFRILIENFREPDLQIGFLFSSLTMGQILSLPLILLGLWLVLKN